MAVRAFNRPHDSDYDGAWKEALRKYLRKLLACFFPELYREIDWRYAPVFLDKEISQLIAQDKRRNGRVDVLVRVRLKNGEDRWILCHLEIQSSREEDFAFRLNCYHGGIQWLFRKRVLTLAILADLDEDWMPSEDAFELGGFRSSLKFPVCKLVKRMDEWAGDHSLPVVLARAQIAALRTAQDPQGRYDAKWQLVRSLYQAGYAREELREAFRLIDWMMKLKSDLESRFRSELEKYEEEHKMPYITSIERLAKQEGREEGREEGHKEGMLDLLMCQLRQRIGLLPDESETRIRKLSPQRLTELGTACFDFSSTDDLTQWLKQRPARRKGS